MMGAARITKKMIRPVQFMSFSLSAVTKRGDIPRVDFLRGVSPRAPLSRAVAKGCCYGFLGCSAWWQEQLQQIVQKPLSTLRRRDADVVTRYQTTQHRFAQGSFHRGEREAGALGEQPGLEAADQAQRIHHELEAQILGHNRMLFLQGRAGRRLLHVFARLLVAHLAQDAIGKRKLGMRAGAYAEVVAEAPVIEVVL